MMMIKAIGFGGIDLVSFIPWLFGFSFPEGIKFKHGNCLA
jgi:hypothetical protein